MDNFKYGERVRLTEAPALAQHWIGNVVYVVALGGIGCDPDDVMIKLPNGLMARVHANQLEHIAP